MAEKMSAKDFINKIQAEGGVCNALDYGLTTDEYDLPAGMVETWGKCEVVFAELVQVVIDFVAAMKKAGLEFTDG